MNPKKKHSIAVLIIIMAAVLLELTLFNRPFYSHFWQGAESTQFEAVDMDYKDGVYTPMTEKEKGSAVSPAFVFNDLNRLVNSVYIEPPADWAKLQKMTFSVQFADQNTSSTKTSGFSVMRGFWQSDYQEINPYGIVTSLKIIPSGSFRIASVAVNRVIPIDFNISRVLLVSILAILIYFLAVTDIRKRIFDPSNRWQTGIFCAVLVGFFVICYSIPPALGSNGDYSLYKTMVDRTLQGQLDLGTKPPKGLADLSDPWDPVARSQAGIGFPGYSFTSAYYDGKFYMIHGIVPVLVLFLPYHLLSGTYLSMSIAMFIFTALAGLFFALLWRAIVRRYFSNLPFALYICTTIAVLFCTLITSNLYYLFKYCMASASAIMFVAAGIWLIFSSLRPTDEGKLEELKTLEYIRVAIGCFCLALSVGCRATGALVSILVPLLLWRLVWKKPWRRVIKLLLFVAVPYVIVAVPLMWYNYARFDSPFEFGIKYMYQQIASRGLMWENPMGKVYLIIQSIKNILLSPITFSTQFPYVLNLGKYGFGPELPQRGLLGVVGLSNFPVFWALGAGIAAFRQGRKSKKIFWEFPLVMILLGLFIGIDAQVLMAVVVRYQVDYMWLFVFPAMIFTVLIWERYGRSSAFAKAVCVLCVLSATIAVTLPSQGTPISIFKPAVYENLKLLFKPFG